MSMRTLTWCRVGWIVILLGHVYECILQEFYLDECKSRSNLMSSMSYTTEGGREAEQPTGQK